MNARERDLDERMLIQLRRIADALERQTAINEQSLRLTEQALSPSPQREFGDRAPYPSSIDQS